MRTLYHAKGFCDQFVWAKVVFLHVGFTLGVVLRKMPTAYYPMMVATDAAAHKVDALIAINNAMARSGMALHRPKTVVASF
jgi:hypothetical protein